MTFEGERFVDQRQTIERVVDFDTRPEGDAQWLLLHFGPPLLQLLQVGASLIVGQ